MPSTVLHPLVCGTSQNSLGLILWKINLSLPWKLIFSKSCHCWYPSKFFKAHISAMGHYWTIIFYHIRLKCVCIYLIFAQNYTLSFVCLICMSRILLIFPLLFHICNLDTVKWWNFGHFLSLHVHSISHVIWCWIWMVAYPGSCYVLWYFPY